MRPTAGIIPARQGEDKGHAATRAVAPNVKQFRKDGKITTPTSRVVPIVRMVIPRIAGRPRARRGDPVRRTADMPGTFLSRSARGAVRPSSPALRVEPLEPRNLPSVTSILNNGILSVSGDPALPNNNIRVL